MFYYESMGSCDSIRNVGELQSIEKREVFIMYLYFYVPEL